MDFRTFKQKLQALRGQQGSASSAGQCQGLLTEHSAQIAAVCSWIGPDCDLKAFAADKAVFTQLGEVVLLGIRAINSPGADTIPDVGVLRTMQSLAMGLQNAMHISMEFGSYPWPSLPAGMLIEWSAAAPHVIQQLRDLKQRQQQQQQQGAAEQPASGGAKRVRMAAAFLLQLLNTAAILEVGQPGLAPFRSVVVPLFPAAAEMAVLLLTSPAGVEAAGDGGGGDAPSAQTQPGVRAVGEDSWPHGVAACFIHLLGEFVTHSGQPLLAAPGSIPPALVSDSVQVAVVLHLAVFLAALVQQQHSSHSTSWLEECGFERDQVDTYSSTVVETFVGPAGADATAAQVTPAAQALQFALLLRGAATTMPGWQQRCAGVVAASATATAPAPAPGRAIGQLPNDGRLFAPGVNPVQLQLLVLETASAGSVRKAAAPAGGRAMDPDASLFLAFLDLAVNVLQSATPPTHAPAEVSAVVAELWLVLGRRLLRLSGSTAEELAGGRESTGSSGGREGGATGAATAAGEPAAVTGSVVQMQLFSAGGAWEVTRGEAVPLPASAGGHARVMMTKFGTTFARTLAWAAGFTEDGALQQIFRAHPVLCSRVYEAAARACTPQVTFSVGTILPVSQVLHGLNVAAKACSPAQLPAQALLTDARLAARMGSQLVSSVKQLQVAADSKFDLQLLSLLFDTANVAATTGSTVWGKPQLAAPEAAAASQQAVLSSAAPRWLCGCQ